MVGVSANSQKKREYHPEVSSTGPLSHETPISAVQTNAVSRFASCAKRGYPCALSQPEANAQYAPYTTRYRLRTTTKGLTLNISQRPDFTIAQITDHFAVSLYYATGCRYAGRWPCCSPANACNPCGRSN